MMKDYDKRACVRRARAELALVIMRIKDEAHDRMKAHIDAAHSKAITDGSTFDANEVGKAAAAFGGAPWGFRAERVIEHQPARKARKR